MSRLQTRAFALTLTALALGCSKKPEPPAGPVTLAAVPPPKGLVAELSIARPGATWAQVRTTMGGPAAMLPASGGLLATTIFDLPPTAAELFDMEIPALGAVVENEGRFAVVLAFHVKDGPKLAEIASTGEAARFTKKPDANSGIVLLDPKEAESGPALGIAGNYLTIAARPADIVAYAPYVTRTLPSRPAAKEDILATLPKAGLAHLVGQIRSEWEELREERSKLEAMMNAQLGGKGSPSSFGYLDKRAASALEILDNLDDARLSLSLEGGFAHVRLAAKPAEGAGAASRAISAMAPGDAKPLLDLPADSAIAVVYRDTAQVRETSATEQVALFEETYGPELKPSDKALFEQTLKGWAKGRGDWMSVGAVWDRDGVSLVARSAVSDTAVLEKAIGDWLRMTEVPAFAEPLSSILGPFKIAAPSTQKDFKTSRITRKAGVVPATLLPSDALPSQLDMAWSVNEQAFVAAIGKDAKAAYMPVAKGTGSKLADVPEAAKLVNALDGDVSFALFAEPRKVVSAVTGKPAPEAAPVLVSFGRSGTNEAWVRLDVSQYALRDLAMLASGL